ncbi:MAG TPA: glycosyl hydrolase family 28-related protein [Chthoniobacterales bacterium]|nr:glycosyl hydrolase family 28-related protein [Chthoniobacterales bacterium]
MRTRLFSIVLLLSLGFCLPAMAEDRINVTDPAYAGGAIPNDGQDDTAAINAAVNAGPANAGRSIYFPPGSYNYTGFIWLPANTSYRFYGDGPGVSTIVFTGNPSGGIWGYNMGSATLQVDGLTLQANSRACGTAIYAVFNPSGSNDKVRSATIHNVQIIRSLQGNSVAGFWNGGIYLERAQNAVIDKAEIIGLPRFQDGVMGAGPWEQPRPPFGISNTPVEKGDVVAGADPGWGDPGQDYGIKWVSSNDYKTTGLQLSNLMIWWCNAALQTSGWVEGLYLNGFEFAFCGDFGVPVIDLSSSAPNLGSAFHLVNGHVGALQNGIRLTNLRGAKVSKILFIHVSGAYADPCCDDNGQPEGCHPRPACNTLPYTSSGDDLALNSSTDAVISANSFVGVGTDETDENCILLNNSHSVQISENYFTHVLPVNPVDACIKILFSSNLVRVINNVFELNGNNPYGGVNRPYNDAATDTYYRGNTQ